MGKLAVGTGKLAQTCAGTDSQHEPIGQRVRGGWESLAKTASIVRERAAGIPGRLLVTGLFLHVLSTSDFPVSQTGQRISPKQALSALMCCQCESLSTSSHG